MKNKARIAFETYTNHFNRSNFDFGHFVAVLGKLLVFCSFSLVEVCFLAELAHSLLVWQEDALLPIFTFPIFIEMLFVRYYDNWSTSEGALSGNEA